MYNSHCYTPSARHDDQINRAMSMKSVCSYCNKLYDANGVGTLMCSYHPFESINNCTRLEPYSRSSPPPTDCSYCNDSHLVPSLRTGVRVGAIRLETMGCVRMDHSVDRQRIMMRPFVCVPLDAARKLDVFRGQDASAFARMLFIDKPGMLDKLMVVNVFGTAESIVVDVADLFSEVCEAFGVADIRMEVRRAAKGPVKSSISRVKGMMHPASVAIHRLYTSADDAIVHFRPFVVIMRVQAPRKPYLVDKPASCGVTRKQIR